jgi:hypothetical protein
MVTIGFLHTAGVHVESFGSLLEDLAPGATATHLVDESLLADARARGIDPDLRERLESRLRELAGKGAEVIVCTCSTISGAAEETPAGVPVVRVDRPMAERAVARGGRVAVVAAVESTLAPTRALLEECARVAGTDPVIVEAPCPDAWPLFEAGDQEGYLGRIAEHVRGLAGDASMIILAQASMAPAAGLLPDLDVPILSSPRAAVRRALEVARSRRSRETGRGREPLDTDQ